MLPMYLKYMGAESYGLVGFFAMVQALFNLLDIGLAPTMARETARFQGGASTALSYRRLLRALQVIFWCTAVVGGAMLFWLAGSIASHWLKLQMLSINDATHAIQLMAAGVALRWVSGLYRAVISGAEQLVWLNGANAFVATVRFVGVFPILMWVGTTPNVFFAYQVMVALLEFGLFALKTRKLVPAVPPGTAIGWTVPLLFKPVSAVASFSISIAFTSSLWALVTQADRLILSRLLLLADYGYFSLAVLAATVVATVGGPISSAVIPRLNRLYAAGEHTQAISLYRETTRMVGAIAFPMAAVIAYFSQDILYLWTGDKIAAEHSANTLALYALGYAVLAITSLSAHLQAASGNMRLHVVGSMLFIGIYVPLLPLLVAQYGVAGAGIAWLLVNGVYLFIWIPKIHSRFSARLHWPWLASDVALAFVVAILVVALPKTFVDLPANRWAALGALAILGCASLAGSYLLTGKIRSLFGKHGKLNIPLHE